MTGLTLVREIAELKDRIEKLELHRDQHRHWLLRLDEKLSQIRALFKD
jgi:hypothetical protein